MKTIWVIANWKSNKNIKEALEWIDLVGPQLLQNPFVKVAVCPPVTDVEEVKKAVLVGSYPLLVGVQDLSPYENGPYTGEEPAKILSGIADLAILGHSERRSKFGETDQMVAKKSIEALKYQIIPLVCVQDENTLIPPGVTLAAYEPPFAIGTNNPEPPLKASEVAKKLKDQYGQDLAVLYGGSVNETNAIKYLEEKLISGLLIGGASLEADQFLEIVKSAYEYQEQVSPTFLTS